MEPSLGLWPEAKLGGSMQMPGLLQPLLSGTRQRQVSAIQGFGLEPVHERLPRVFTAQGDQPFFGQCSLVHHFLPEPFGFFLVGH